MADNNKRLTRGEAIITFCRDCMGDSSPRHCEVGDCPLYRYRTRPEDTSAPGRRLIRSRAIRVKCIDCMGGQVAIVSRCPATGCVLHPYRMGHRDDEALKVAERADFEHQTPDTDKSDPTPAGSEDAPKTRRSGEGR